MLELTKDGQKGVKKSNLMISLCLEYATQGSNMVLPDEISNTELTKCFQGLPDGKLMLDKTDNKNVAKGK